MKDLEADADYLNKAYLLLDSIFFYLLSDEGSKEFYFCLSLKEFGLLFNSINNYPEFN